MYPFISNRKNINNVLLFSFHNKKCRFVDMSGVIRFHDPYLSGNESKYINQVIANNSLPPQAN